MCGSGFYYVVIKCGLFHHSFFRNVLSIGIITNMLLSIFLETVLGREYTAYFTAHYFIKVFESKINLTHTSDKSLKYWEKYIPFAMKPQNEWLEPIRNLGPAYYNSWLKTHRRCCAM